MPILNHRITLYIILIVILISENIFLSQVAAASTIFVTFTVVVIIFAKTIATEPFTIVGLIITNRFFIISHLRILQNFNVFKTV